GVIKAIREVGVDVPLVVRLSGTKVEEGRRILADSGEKIIVADTLAEAAEKAVAAWRAATKKKAA
ncbi:succinate--CoA ligase subunit beta, partial [Mesorhizobium sp. M7D.F.Ca.US.004.01.2.1]